MKTPFCRSQELLLAGVPILEGLDLSGVPDGNYILAAFPLNWRGWRRLPYGRFCWKSKAVLQCVFV